MHFPVYLNQPIPVEQVSVLFIAGFIVGVGEEDVHIPGALGSAPVAPAHRQLVPLRHEACFSSVL